MHWMYNKDALTRVDPLGLRWLAYLPSSDVFTLTMGLDGLACSNSWNLRCWSPVRVEELACRGCYGSFFFSTDWFDYDVIVTNNHILLRWNPEEGSRARVFRNNPEGEIMQPPWFVPLLYGPASMWVKFLSRYSYLDVAETIMKHSTHWITLIRYFLMWREEFPCRSARFVMSWLHACPVACVGCLPGTERWHY